MVNIYASGKIVGVAEDGIFIKTVKSSQHFLRKPPAIAFDISSLTDAQYNGCDRVQVIDKDTGKVYTQFIEFIFLYGFQVDRGFGQQVALPLDSWVVSALN